MSVALVSVVIPTRGRPQLLARALDSVARQTHPRVETIVVVDGPDAETEAMLRKRVQPGLRWVTNAQAAGSNAARNRGIAEATGAYVALLDDDDEFLPAKLERQLLALTSQGSGFAICRVVVRSPRSEVVWPRRPPRPGEHLSEYLFARSSLFAGEGKIQTSMLMAPRAMFEQVPFDPSLPRYQEADWALRAADAGAQLAWCPDPLVVWHVDEARETITSRYAGDAQFAISWIRERRHLVTRRAYAAYLLSRVSSVAANRGQRRLAIEIWRDAWRHGSPRFIDLLLFAGKLAIPAGLRSALRRRLGGARARTSATAR